MLNRVIDLFTVYDAILAGGQNTEKITVNVWDFGPLGTAITPLRYSGSLSGPKSHTFTVIFSVFCPPAKMAS